jgi:hypothetical protein
MNDHFGSQVSGASDAGRGMVPHQWQQCCSKVYAASS